MAEVNDLPARPGPTMHADRIGSRVTTANGYPIAVDTSGMTDRATKFMSDPVGAEPLDRESFDSQVEEALSGLTNVAILHIELTALEFSRLGRSTRRGPLLRVEANRGPDQEHSRGPDQQQSEWWSTGLRCADCVGRLLRASVRSHDIVGRVGDASFGVLISFLGPTGDRPTVVTGRLLDLLRQPISLGQGWCRPQLAVGIAISGKGTTAGQLMARAEAAAAKAAVGSRPVLADRC